MKILYTICTLFFALNSWSQNEIDSLCTNYDSKIQTSIDEEMPELIPTITFETELIKAAIGNVSYKTKIYFDIEEAFNESESDYPQNQNAVIRKVNFQISSVSYLIENTFYYDEDGSLIKHVKNESGYGCYIRSTYFNKSKAFKQYKNPPKKQTVIQVMKQILSIEMNLRKKKANS